MIDRLVLGRPPRDVLIRRARELLRVEWTLAEVATRYSMSENAIGQMLVRARRREVSP